MAAATAAPEGTTPRSAASKTAAPATTDVETGGSERLVLAVLAVATVALGLLPWLVLGVMEPTVAALLGGGR